MLSYTDARQKVIEVAGALPRQQSRAPVEIEQAFGRILAAPVLADRDYPPFDRSTRDGFAVRAADAQQPGARLECVLLDGSIVGDRATVRGGFDRLNIGEYSEVESR